MGPTWETPGQQSTICQPDLKQKQHTYSVRSKKARSTLCSSLAVWDAILKSLPLCKRKSEFLRLRHLCDGFCCSFNHSHPGTPAIFFRFCTATDSRELAVKKDPGVEVMHLVNVSNYSACTSAFINMDLCSVFKGR